MKEREKEGEGRERGEWRKWERKAEEAERGRGERREGEEREDREGKESRKGSGCGRWVRWGVVPDMKNVPKRACFSCVSCCGRWGR
jgi:hypothetical protein